MVFYDQRRFGSAALDVKFANADVIAALVLASWIRS